MHRLYYGDRWTTSLLVVVDRTASRTEGRTGVIIVLPVTFSSCRAICSCSTEGCLHRLYYALLTVLVTVESSKVAPPLLCSAGGIDYTRDD